VINWATVTGFDWDSGNAAKSERKHGVSCREAEEIFHNEPLVVALDAAHSDAETRYHALGCTDEGRLLHATFTVRGEKLRVISIRQMNRKEKSIYESQS